MGVAFHLKPDHTMTNPNHTPKHCPSTSVPPGARQSACRRRQAAITWPGRLWWPCRDTRATMPRFQKRCVEESPHSRAQGGLCRPSTCPPARPWRRYVWPTCSATRIEAAHEVYPTCGDDGGTRQGRCGTWEGAMRVRGSTGADFDHSQHESPPFSLRNGRINA